MKKIIFFFFSLLLISSGFAVTISQIQQTNDPGNDGTYPSNYENSTVTTSGIVTAILPNQSNFYIQEQNGAAWSGISIYAPNNVVAIGDLVEVTGEVSEYYGKTEILSSTVNILSNNNSLPEPVYISTNDVNLEMYESVLVQVRNLEVISVFDNYNNFEINDGSGVCKVDDTIVSFEEIGFTAEIGLPIYTLTGIVDYSYAEFKINPRSEDDFIFEQDTIVPDYNFRVKINEYLSQDENYYPTINDLESLTGTIDANTSNIHSIEGAQYLTNIEELILFENQIEDITCLENLENLTSINLDYNQIYDLSPLANLYNLRYFTINYNPIIDISPLENLTDLQSLSVDHCQVEDIYPIQNLTNIYNLSLNSNNISDISVLVNFINISYLYINDNQITDIYPLIQNEALGDNDWLNISDNPLSKESFEEFIPILSQRNIYHFWHSDYYNQFAACYPYPQRGDIMENGEVNFQWRGDPTEATYTIYIGEDRYSMQEVGLGEALNDSTLVYSHTFEFSRNYFWQIKTTIGSDIFLSGLWDLDVIFDDSNNIDFMTYDTVYEIVDEIEFIPEVSFTPIEWQWDFNEDGIIDSYDENPIWIYNYPGTFDIYLKVFNESGSEYELLKENYITILPADNQKLVTLELFSESWCAYSAIARETLKELAEQSEYLIPIIWEGDQNVIPAHQGRVDEYGISAIPVAVFNAENAIVGSPTLSMYQNAYYQALSYISPISLDVSYIHANDYITIEADATILSDLDNSEEYNIVYMITNAYNDEYFCSIVDYYEEDFPLRTTGSSGNFAHDFEIDNSWNLDSLKVIALIQYANSNGTVNEINTYPILQSAFENVELSLNANFIASSTEILSGEEIQFTDQSTGNPISWQWDFDNDGNFDSTEQNPVWIYEQPGTYSVTLKVYDGISYNQFTRENYIEVIDNFPFLAVTISSGGISVLNQINNTVYGPYLTDEFTTNDALEIVILKDGKTAVVSCFNSHQIKFIDFTNPLAPTVTNSYSLDFAPEDIAITNNGNYLLITDGGSSTHIGIIDLYSRTLVQNIDLAPRELQAVAVSPSGLVLGADYEINKIHMFQIDLSTGEFTDLHSSIDIATGPNNIAFNNNGEYAIITSPGANKISLLKIEGANQISMVSEFNADAQSVIFNKNSNRFYAFLISSAGNQFGFYQVIEDEIQEVAPAINLSSSSTGYFYGVDAITLSPDNGYAYVTNATNTYGQTTNSISIININDESFHNSIEFGEHPVSCAFGNYDIYLDANFIASSTEILQGEEIQFTDQSIGNPISWQWDFDNDGNFDSTEQNPVWIYGQPGTYSVSLTISDGESYETETKQNYIQVEAIPTTSLEGLIVNSFTGNPVPNALIQFVNLNLSTTSDANGNYYIDNIPEGALSIDFAGSPREGDFPLEVNFSSSFNYNLFQISVSAENFLTYTTDINIDQLEHEVRNFSLTPDNQINEISLVLSWQAEPRDLDSHLLTPEIEGNSYHIYYASEGNLEIAPYAQLDLDDTNGYGPETISISEYYSGTYHYYIHKFSGIGTLAGSNAFVDIYQNSSLYSTITIPETGNGDYWHVCNIDGSTGAITIINTVGNSAPSTIRNDISQNEKRKWIYSNNEYRDLTWEWDFESDGTIDNTNQNPTFIYEIPGQFDVSLTAQDENDSVTLVKENYIMVTGSINIPPIVQNPMGTIDIVANSSDSTSINLNDVFYDENGDVLSFSYSNNEHIDIEILQNGSVRFTPEYNWFGTEDIIFYADDEATVIINRQTRYITADTLTVNVILPETTYIDAGEISGVWDNTSSYLITGEVSIPIGEELIINGTEEMHAVVIFPDEFSFVVDGILTANYVDFIDYEGNLWNGIIINDNTNNTTISNCLIQNAFVGITINGCSPAISTVEVINDPLERVITETGIVINDAASPSINGLVIDNYSKKGIEIINESTSSSIPTISNLRVQNSSNSLRDSLNIGIDIQGKVAIQLDDVVLKDFTNGINFISDGSQYRDIPTLSNIRVQNSSNSLRSTNKGINIENVSTFVAIADTVINYPIGMKIATTESFGSIPTLSNIRVQNSSNSLRDTLNVGIFISGNVVANMNDIEMNDFATGMIYESDGTQYRDIPTLSNIRVQNSSNSLRSGTKGIVIKDLSAFITQNDTISNCSSAIEIITTADNSSIPTLSNIRVQNSSNSMRTENNIGIKFDGNIDNGFINKNYIANCDSAFVFTGNISTIIDSSTVYNLENNEARINAVGLYAENADISLSNNTFYNFTHALVLSSSNAELNSNILWDDEPNPDIIITDNEITANSNTIYLPNGEIIPGNVNLDPNFLDINPEEPDFHLQNGPVLALGIGSLGFPDYEYSTELAPNWNLVGLPVTLQWGHSSPIEVLADDINPFSVYQYNSSILAYNSSANSFVVPDSVRIGQGYWLLANQGGLIDEIGYVSYDSLTVNVSGENNPNDGWHLVANPYDVDIPYSNIDTVGDVMTGGYIYNSNSNQYELVMSDSLIPAWSGMFIKGNSNDAEIIFHHQRRNEIEDRDIDGWSIVLTAEAEAINSTTIVGASEHANDDHDCYDILSLPNLPFIPAMNKINLYTKHNNWLNYSGNYRCDMMNIDNEEWIYPLELTTDSDAILSISRLSNFPEEYAIFAENIATGEIVNLKDDDLYILYEGRNNGNDLSDENYKVSENRTLSTISLQLRITSNPLETPEDFVPVYKLGLFQNYPNPFNPTTNIRFSLPEDADVNLSVYNVKGQKVIDLINDEMPKGYNTAVWNGLDSSGRKVSSGVYFYKLSYKNEKIVRKMLMLK